MVRGVPQGTVVHHTHPCHLLNCTEAPGSAGGREKSLRYVCIGPGQGAEASERARLETEHTLATTL